MKAGVYNNGILAGVLEKRLESAYSFEYDEVYLQNDKNPPIFEPHCTKRAAPPAAAAPFCTTSLATHFFAR